MSVGLLSFASTPVIAPPFVLTLNYESSALAAPQSFRDACQSAANILTTAISDPITVRLQVGYNDWNNGSLTNLGGSAVGVDVNGSSVSYSVLRAAMATKASRSVNSTNVINALPNTSTLDGNSFFYVSPAVQKSLGIIAANSGTLDGIMGIGSSIPTGNLVGAILHEMTHCLGRENGVEPFDFCRFTAVGTRNYSSAATSVASYFSVDGGTTKLADYGQTSDPGDFLNTGVQGATDAFNEFYSGSTLQNLSLVDKKQMDALGYTVSGVT